MDSIDRLIVWSNKEPILTIRRVLWAVTTGWALFVAFIFAAVGMCMSIIGIPFAIQTLQFAVLCLDPIPREVYAHQWSPTDLKSKPWNNPVHPLTIAANIVWLVFFGWAIVLLFWASALIQALTIIGIGTAIQMFELSLFALWPFGRGIRHKQLPTTLEELHVQKAAKKAAKMQKQGHHGSYNEASFTDTHPQPNRGPLNRNPSNVDVV
jgi:uncharacterized membrane protein YccF (DUF307 family)